MIQKIQKGVEMKNIQNFDAEKYSDKTRYNQINKGIYEMSNPKKLYVTSLSFEQEPEYGEGSTAADISQYPLEDILDRYLCHVSDFYESLNTEKSKTCYLEFASENQNEIQELRKIIGKHVYNMEVMEEDKVIVRLVIK